MTIIYDALPPRYSFIALIVFYDDYCNTTYIEHTTTSNSLLDAGTNLHYEQLLDMPGQQALHTLGLTAGTRVRMLEDPSDLSKGPGYPLPPTRMIAHE